MHTHWPLEITYHEEKQWQICKHHCTINPPKYLIKKNMKENTCVWIWFPNYINTNSNTNRCSFHFSSVLSWLFWFAVLLSPCMFGQMEQKGQPHEKITLHYCRMHNSMHCFLTWCFSTKGRLLKRSKWTMHSWCLSDWALFGLVILFLTSNILTVVISIF